MNQQEVLYRFHRVSGDSSLSKNEIALRNALIDKLRSSGLEVITDVEEGQRVLDEANRKAVRLMSFGEPYDYEQYPLGRVEPGLTEKTVALVKTEVNHGFSNYREARNWARQNIAKLYGIEETGGKGEVRISNGAIDKFLSQSAVEKSDSKDVHMSVLKILPNVLKSSIDVETHPDFLKGKDGKRSAANGINKDVLVHRLYGAVDIDSMIYRVKITLKENTKTREATNTHSYEATKIELLAGQHGDVTKTSPRNSNNSISAAKLLKDVEMSYNPGKKILDASEKRNTTIREYRIYHDNSVIFNESDIRVTDHIRFFRSSKGESYGFTMNGKIYIDPRIATAETPIHEYTHLWADMVRRQDSGAWQDIVSLMQDTPVWETVRMQYPELTSTDDIADEVLARFSGQHGAARLRSVMDRVMKDKGATTESAALDVIRRVKEALKKFWEKVCSLLDIKSMNPEALADRVLSDLLDGVDLKKATVADIPGIRSEVLAAVKASGIDPGKVTKEQWTSLLKGRRTALGSGTGKLFMLAKAPVGYALKAVNTVNSLTRSAGMEM